MSAADVDRLQIIEDLDVHIGSALMTVNGEPVAARTLVMKLTYHVNQDRTSQTALFGMDQQIAMGVTGALLYTLCLAYGDDTVADLLDKVKEKLPGGDPG